VTPAALDGELAADWTYHGHHQPSYDDARAAARGALIDAFSNHESASVQHTLYTMGEAVIGACPDVDAVRIRMPNKHHIPVDLAAFGLPNDRASTSRPTGRSASSRARSAAPNPAT